MIHTLVLGNEARVFCFPATFAEQILDDRALSRQRRGERRAGRSTGSCLGKSGPMDGAILRAQLSTGDGYDDPSEDLLYELLRDIERGEATFVIVDRLGVADTFAQAVPEGDGTWWVEHRAGSAERHFQHRAADLRAAHVVLTAWAFQLSGWDTAVEWEPISTG